MIDIEKHRVEFEAAGTAAHGWNESKYLRPTNWDGKPNGDYIWLEQRRAFALWLIARAMPSARKVSA